MPITGALRQTSEKLFTWVKVWRNAKKFGVGGKTVYEIDTQLMLRLCNSKPCKTLNDFKLKKCCKNLNIQTRKINIDLEK